MSGKVRIVHNKLLGGWFIVRGAHQTPIGGRFESREAAAQHLEARKYAATLPPGVAYIPTKDGGHNSREANEAYRRTSDETNARWRASIAAEKEKG